MNTTTNGFAGKAARIQQDLANHVRDRGKLAVVKAPPGSGKTRLLIKSAETAFNSDARVAVATQTNSQADDICVRIARDYPAVRAVRFAGTGHVPRRFGPNVQWVTNVHDLPAQKCVVVGTSAKWNAINVPTPFDFLFVEEAWQLSWADFMLLGQVSKRFILIGDPGQIPPVVTVDSSRWETSPRPPHRPAPEVILADGAMRGLQVLELPATWRLPFDSVPLIQPFYEFEFGANAQPGDRALKTRAGGRRAVDRVVEVLRASSVAALTLPTPDGGPPLEEDVDLAREAVGFVKRLLSSEAKVVIGGKPRPLVNSDIGIAATHRAMNAVLEKEAQASRLKSIRVDTPERWQGLELPVMIAVHPLSGVVRPSSFDLETGRLCVMASRHQVSVIVVTRDHVRDTLRNFIPAADQPVGRDDLNGRGHACNLSFWEQLEDRGLVVSA